MKYRQLFILLIACLFGSLHSNAQIIKKSYSLPDINSMNISGATPTSDGGLLVTGFETYYDGYPDPTPAIGFIMKVDSVGDMVWLDTFHQVAVFGDPELTSDGGFLTCLNTIDIGAGGFILSETYEIAKFDALGNLLFRITTDNTFQGVPIRYFEINNQIIVTKGSLYDSWERYDLNTGLEIDSIGYSLGLPYPQHFIYSEHENI